MDKRIDDFPDPTGPIMTVSFLGTTVNVTFFKIDDSSFSEMIFTLFKAIVGSFDDILSSTFDRESSK